MSMPSRDQRELERTRYWQGQMLRAGDFRGQVASDLQLRWWHNRALHNAYGVALGYEATAIWSEATLLGFEFAPGVAYDCFGRGLMLLRSHTVLLPENSNGNTLTLVIRYRENGDFPDPRQTNGVCLTGCEDSMAGEHPDFAWTTADPPAPREGVALVRVLSGGGEALRVDSAFEMLTSQPLAGPYLADGSTIPGATPWRSWNININEVQFQIGIETDIDTSAAGFNRIPCYFARLAGLDAAALTSSFGSVAIFTHIAHVRPDGFRFRILPAGDRQSYNWSSALLQTLASAYVCWLGCESLADTSQCLNPEARKSCCS